MSPATDERPAPMRSTPMSGSRTYPAWPNAPWSRRPGRATRRRGSCCTGASTPGCTPTRSAGWAPSTRTTFVRTTTGPGSGAPCEPRSKLVRPGRPAPCPLTPARSGGPPGPVDSGGGWWHSGWPGASRCPGRGWPMATGASLPEPIRVVAHHLGLQVVSRPTRPAASADPAGQPAADPPATGQQQPGWPPTGGAPEVNPRLAAAARVGGERQSGRLAAASPKPAVRSPDRPCWCATDPSCPPS